MKYLVITTSLLFFVIGYFMSVLPAEEFIEIGSIIAVVVIALPAFYGMYRIYGSRGIIIIFILGLFSLAIETIGIHTGFPYSSFEYTMPFGYQLFGTTPWTVAIAWSPLVTGAFVLAHAWFKNTWSQLMTYLGLLVGTDLVLDPGAVARGLWQYTNGGWWYGVPLQNFLGWIFSGLIAYGLMKLILEKAHFSKRNILLASLSLLLSIILWTGVSLGYSLWIPMIFGIILGSILIFGIIQNKKPSHE